MAKLGSVQHPARVRVRTRQRAEEIFAECARHGWQVIIGIEPDTDEDITDFERLVNPPKPIVVADRPGRNDPCPCGSGKKYKRCHGS